ncbi:MAG: methylamine utilization protein, partial [Planctomycetota bacterium]
MTLAGISAAGRASAEETGTLRIKFAYDGKVPEAEAIKVTADKEFCGHVDLKDESLQVNKEGKGIKNFIVYLYQSRRGPKLPKVKAEPKVIELANKDCRFEPHVVVMRSDLDVLKVTNPDKVTHNAAVNCLVNDAQNPTIPPGGAAEIKFKGPEISPFDVKCSIHPWMKAMVVAFDHPYVGVSDANGVVEIKNIPAGTELTFRANHEAATGKLDGLKQDGKSVTWRA